MTNCPNCGAPITSRVCEYCGTVFRSVDTRDYTEFEFHKATARMLQEQRAIQDIYQQAIDTMRSYRRGTL